MATGGGQDVLLPPENALQAFGSNRLVDDSGDPQLDQPVDCLGWSNEEVKQGKILKVKGMPNDCKRKRFRVWVSTHRTNYLVTNEAEPRETAAAEQESSVRWTMEPFHRERKQLTGMPACQCRLARSQHNHIALAVRAYPPQTSHLPDPKNSVLAQTRIFGYVHEA